MAESLNEISNIGEELQLNVSADMPRYPGEIVPYELPDVADITIEPFDPITYFAISESGQSGGPLDEENLKKFLRHKLNRRWEPTLNIISEYTNDVSGLQVQLTCLRNRIKEINIHEDDGNNFFQKRIKKLVEALRKGKRTHYSTYPFSLSNAAKEAFRVVGSEGPLSEMELIRFIQTGNAQEATEEATEEFIDLTEEVTEKVMDLTEEETEDLKTGDLKTGALIGQLRKLLRRFRDNLDIENKKRKDLYDRILKALDDILMEYDKILSSTTMNK